MALAAFTAAVAFGMRTRSFASVEVEDLLLTKEPVDAFQRWEALGKDN